MYARGVSQGKKRPTRSKNSHNPNGFVELPGMTGPAKLPHPSGAPPHVTDIFEEVDESLRQETLLQWWKRMMPVLIGVVVLVIAGVGVLEFFKWQRDQEIDKQAQAFDTAVTALDKKDLAAAKTAFAQIGEGKGGFAAIANHMLAGVEKDLTDDKAAIAQHLAAAAERDNGVVGDIAVLKLAYAKADTADLAEIEKTVAPLIAKGGYIAALGRELVAAKAFAGGDVERARTEYQALSLEIEAPQSMKIRVQQTLLTFPPRPVASAPLPAAAPAPAAPGPAPAAPAQPPAKPGQ